MESVDIQFSRLEVEMDSEGTTFDEIKVVLDVAGEEIKLLVDLQDGHFLLRQLNHKSFGVSS